MCDTELKSVTIFYTCRKIVAWPNVKKHVPNSSMLKHPLKAKLSRIVFTPGSTATIHKTNPCWSQSNGKKRHWGLKEGVNLIINPSRVIHLLYSNRKSFILIKVWTRFVKFWYLFSLIPATVGYLHGEHFYMKCGTYNMHWFR